MEEHIDNSEKHYLIRLGIFFTIVLMIYYGLSNYGYNEANKKPHEFIDDINSKTILLQSLSVKPDIIFIGSSTTKYHVSTNLFKTGNMNIFNYGIEGHYFTTYPLMIEHAIKAHPKIIAISINVQELYYRLFLMDTAFSKGIDVRYENLRFFIKHYLDHLENDDELSLILKLIQTRIEQRDYFCLYGYQYTDNIKSAYESFNPGYCSSFVADTPITNPAIVIHDYRDCEVEPGTIASLRYRCKNGDGIFTGQDKTLDFRAYYSENIFRDKKFNYEHVSVINGMLDKIRENGITPVLVFMPQFENPIYNQNLIKQSVHANIIDLSHFSIPKDGWHNNGHFNAKGRHVFSTELADRFKPLIFATKSSTDSPLIASATLSLNNKSN